MRKRQNWICPLCNQFIKTNHQKHLKYCNGFGTRRSRPKNPQGSGWSKGLTKDTDKRIAKISKSLTGNKNWEKWPESKKKKHAENARKRIQERYKNGWEPKAGRCPKYKYKNFTVDGSWELEFCKWADEIGLIFERNNERFDYEFEGVSKKYKPDFKIDEGIYIEIKGYQTDRDLAKWNSFPFKLIILKRSQIRRIKRKEFKKGDLYEYIYSGLAESG